MMRQLQLAILIGLVKSQSLTVNGEAIAAVGSSGSVPQFFQTTPELFAGIHNIFTYAPKFYIANLRHRSHNNWYTSIPCSEQSCPFRSKPVFCPQLPSGDCSADFRSAQWKEHLPNPWKL